MNKTVKIVLSVLIFLVIGVLITVFALNFKTITSGSQLYTYDQVQEAYNDGLEENKNLLDKKDEQIEMYKNQLLEINALLEENAQTINSLETTISELQALNSGNAELISSLQGQVASLQSQNTELQNLVDAYEDALPILVNENQAIVKFMVGNELKDIQVIDKNTTVSNPYQVDFEEGNVSTFNGWKVNGELIDINTYVVTDHVVFVADITEKVKVTYTVNGESLSSEIILSGSKPNFPTLTGYESYFFYGWYHNDIKVESDTFVATENITLNAVVKQTITATFMANDTVYLSQSLTKNDSLQIPTNPTQEVNGRLSRFNGWKVNGDVVDLSSYVMTEDTTFVADFSKQIVITINAYYRFDSSSSSYNKLEEGKLYGLTANDCLKTITMYAGDEIRYREITTGSYRDSFFDYAYSSTASGHNSFLGNIASVIEGAVILDGDFTDTISASNISQYEYVNLGETPVFYDDCNIAVLFRSNP